VLNADGSFTYTPNANVNGTDSFTYKANDGTADSNVATVTITVNTVNDAPAAVDDSYGTNEDTALTIAAPGVLGNDTDVDGSSLSAIRVSGPASGTLVLNADGSFTYTPNANFNGTDSFTYKANDGAADSNVATVTITVNAVNDAPAAVDDSYGTNEDTALTIAAPGVLGNDTDVDGNALSAIQVSGPANGTLVLNADGSFTYTPNANVNGTDSFTYKANDGTADSNTVTVTITVTPVNDAPTIAAIANQTGTVGVPVTPVTAVGSDVDAGDTLSYSASNLPPGLGIDPASGTISGTPTIAGIFHVTVTVTDSSMASASTSFDWVIESPIVVNPGDQVNAEGDRVRLRIQTTLSSSGRGGVKFTATGLPAGLDINGSGQIQGRIDENAAGVYTVVVTVTKDDVSASVSFKWTVLDDNGAPRIEKQQDRWHDEGDAVWMRVEAGDPDGDRLTFTQEGLPPGLELDARNGVIRGQLTRMTSVGTHVVTITVSDGSLTASQTFRWTIREKNRAPWMPRPGNRNNDEDDTVFFQLPGADPDWDPLTFTATGLPPGVIVDPDGTVYGHLPLGSAGTYFVNLTLSDGRESASVTFSWIVAPRPRWTLWWHNQNHDDDHADEDDRKRDEDDRKKDEQADDDDGDRTKNEQADDDDGTKNEDADEGDGTKNEHADDGDGTKNEHADDGDGTKNEHADEVKKDEKTNHETREEQKN
jgi:VCBS repeat-containing protein